MEQYVASNDDSNANLNTEITKVPKTLKTLGILSLIMGGLVILISLWSLKKDFLPSEQDNLDREKVLEMVQQQNPMDGYEKAVKILDDQGTVNIVTLLVQIISVIGVVMMLKLKKNGFYFYLVGELISYLILIILFGITSLAGIAVAYGGLIQTIGFIVAGLVVVQDIVFIVLYSRQLKYMS